MTTQAQMLADVASAAANAATAPTAPPAATTTTTAPPAASAETAKPEAAASTDAQASAFTPRVALEMTALAYPSMAASLTKLAVAADGGEGAFRSALLAERAGGDGAATTVSTSQTATGVKEPGKAAAEGRGAGLKAAAQAQNGK